jgi:hypothetical protein
MATVGQSWTDFSYSISALANICCDRNSSPLVSKSRDFALFSSEMSAVVPLR